MRMTNKKTIQPQLLARLCLPCASLLLFLSSSVHAFSAAVVVVVVVDVRPSVVQCDGVTHSYPDSLWRRLTSSVPRRALALDSVTLRLESSSSSSSQKDAQKPFLYLLTGPSSSGKSTLFGLLLLSSTHRQQQQQAPSVGGSITIGVANSARRFRICDKEMVVEPMLIDDDDDRAIHDSLPMAAQVMMLDEKPPLWNPGGNKNITPRQWLQQRAIKTASDPKAASAVVDLLIHALTDGDDWMNDMASNNTGARRELSQSQLYIMQLIETAFESMTTIQQPQQGLSSDPAVVTVPAPILLLDEWLDKETSTVIRAVHAALNRLIETTGAVVVCATHVPQRFDLTCCRRIYLQSGRVVSATAAGLL